jgi:hypothetical protein
LRTPPLAFFQVGQVVSLGHDGRVTVTFPAPCRFPGRSYVFQLKVRFRGRVGLLVRIKKQKRTFSPPPFPYALMR